MIIFIRRLIFKIKIIFFVIITLFVIFFSVFIVQIEKHFVPVAVAITEKYANSRINQAINESIEKVIKNMELGTSQFFEIDNFQNTTNYLNVDNILINEVCTKISETLSNALNSLENSKIPLQLGGLTGINYLSNLGPNIYITITSIGDSVVDYETKFESVGINQINFQIWLNISTKVHIVSPLHSDEINVSRKMALVNTIFNGEIPKTYFNTGQKNS